MMRPEGKVQGNEWREGRRRSRIPGASEATHARARMGLTEGTEALKCFSRGAAGSDLHFREITGAAVWIMDWSRAREQTERLKAAGQQGCKRRAQSRNT